MFGVQIYFGVGEQTFSMQADFKWGKSMKKKNVSRRPKIGTRFGKLSVVGLMFVRKEHRMVFCDCDCGTKNYPIRVERLYSGNTETCGCGRWPAKTGHAAQNSRTYRSYQHMLRRVQSHPGYTHVRIAPHWLGPHGFENFLADLGPRPAGMTLGRILDGDLYSKETAEWQSLKEQGANRRGRSAQKRFSEFYGHKMVRVS
jgi:hypothetical protein